MDSARPADPPDPRTRRVIVTSTVIAILVLAAYVLGREGTQSQARFPVASEREGTGSTLDRADIVDVIPRDGIPAIDDPVLVPAGQVSWLAEKEPVITVEVHGEARAYPLQILTWHEVVNDQIGGLPVVVTFCPLCNTALVYQRPDISGRTTTFGVSGKLINSNLLMYDRASESLWPQVTGRALTGPQRGRELRRIPAQIASWADFYSAYPDGLVLSRDTGHERRYGENPYPGYDEIGSSPFLYEGEVDGRLAAVERVLGVEVGSEVMAFPYFLMKQRGRGGASVAESRIGRLPVVVFWKQGTTSALDDTEISVSRDVGASAAFSRRGPFGTLSFTVVGGRILDTRTRSTWDLFGRATRGPLAGQRLRPLGATDSFWFDWAAFHPETRVWRP